MPRTIAVPWKQLIHSNNSYTHQIVMAQTPVNSVSPSLFQKLQHRVKYNKTSHQKIERNVKTSRKQLQKSMQSNLLSAGLKKTYFILEIENIRYEKWNIQWTFKWPTDINGSNDFDIIRSNGVTELSSSVFSKIVQQFLA